MNVIDLEILIPASPDFIWRFVGDLAKSVNWQEGVRSVSFLTTQREGKGDSLALFDKPRKRCHRGNRRLVRNVGL